ncbi:MAG: serine--tRNA ligase [Bacteroidota bacterium]
MLEINKLRTQTDTIIQNLVRKQVKDAEKTVNNILEVDAKRRAIQVELDQLRAEMNKVAKSIGKLKKEGNESEASKAQARTGEIKQRIKELEEDTRQVDQQLTDQLLTLPNTPHESVPVGKSADDNEVVSETELKKDFGFKAKPHWDLAVEHDIIDWKRGVKVTGAGFPIYKGKGARLQRALITYFLEKAGAAGYTEYQPPLLVNEDSAYGTGQLPDKDGQMYHATGDNFYLIPTAEVPITNIFRGDIVKESEFPIKACGYTPCFRREAGSYGKDVKGLNRLHQFDKVELVQIVHPDKSYETLEDMTQHVEGLLEDLGLPYRRLLLCTGDMSFTSAKTFDLEVYSAAQERWLEVSSVSNFETYQTNRLKLRFKDENKKTQLCHSLNGSALALPRIVAALLENYQQEDGSILIPKCLQPYTGFEKIG